MNNLPALFGKLFSFGSDSEGSGQLLTRAARISDEDFTYQLFIPRSKTDGGKLPVIVFLHGIRERGKGGFISGMFAQLVKAWLNQVPAIVLFPQCRPGKYWSDASMDEMVMLAVEQTFDEFGGDESRLSLIGVSMGGYGAWHFASHYPGRFAALVSICGGSPIASGERFSPIAERIGRTPVWVFHGAEDRIVPVSESRRLVEAIKAKGGQVKYSEYPGAGHNVWLNALGEKELLPWLLAQSRPEPAR